MILLFEPLVMTFEGIHYAVDVPQVVISSIFPQLFQVQIDITFSFFVYINTYYDGRV